MSILPRPDITVTTTPTPSLRDALDALNRAFRDDPAAVEALITNKIPTNTALAHHDTVVVGPSPHDGDRYLVSALGLVNGVVGALFPGYRIASCWDAVTDGRPKLTGFAVVDESGQVVDASAL